MNVDRCSLAKIIKPAYKFLDELIQKLGQFSPHHFIMKQQAEYFRQARQNTTNEEVVTVADFSENHSFVLQNEITYKYVFKRGIVFK